MEKTQMGFNFYKSDWSNMSMWLEMQFIFKFLFNFCQSDHSGCSKQCWAVLNVTCSLTHDGGDMSGALQKNGQLGVSAAQNIAAWISLFCLWCCLLRLRNSSSAWTAWTHTQIITTATREGSLTLPEHTNPTWSLAMWTVCPADLIWKEEKKNHISLQSEKAKIVGNESGLPDGVFVLFAMFPNMFSICNFLVLDHLFLFSPHGLSQNFFPFSLFHLCVFWGVKQES